MAVVVVTVTEPAAVATAPTSSAPASSLSPMATAGIIIGALLGGVFFIALALYLFKRRSRHKFTSVLNPPHEDAGGADLRYLPSFSARRPRLLSRYSCKPSISSEPLISEPPLPPLPPTLRRLSAHTPHIDAMSLRGSPHSSFDLGEIKQVTASGTASRAAILVPQLSSVSSWPDLGDTSPHARQMSSDGTSSPSTPTKSHLLFLHRMLKSRAQASEVIAFERRPSLDIPRSRSSTPDTRVDEEGLAEAERTALRDAEIVQGDEEAVMTEEEVDWEDMETTESIYSQVSAPRNHSMFFSNSASRSNSTSSLPRRKSSRKQRAPAPSAMLPSLSEIPGSPRVVDGQPISPPVSMAACSSLDAQMSDRTISPPMPLEQSWATFPLLTSLNFGKGSLKAHTPVNSISSTAVWGSICSSGPSRYPSLAPSSIGLSPGPRSDVDSHWHHPPAGLSGLASLDVGPFRSPYSPVEERRQHPGSLSPGNRAHLREGRPSSIPEVEIRDVMQAGFARIDVAL